MCPCPYCTRCLPSRRSECRPAWRRCKRPSFSMKRSSSPTFIYTFKHALTRQVAVQSVLHRTRHELRRQIAGVLETQFASTVETQPERLAHHYTEAGLSAQAVTYWQCAEQRAMDRSALVEAIRTTGQNPGRDRIVEEIKSRQERNNG